MSQSIYSEVTAKIIKAMQGSDGRVEKPWLRGAGGRPVNAVTHNPYHGVNVVLLWAVAEDCGYTSNEWATYRQWQQIGGQVRKDERSARIVFYKPMQSTDIDKDTGEEVERHWPLVKYAYVFNRNQADGVEQLVSETPASSIEYLDDFVRHTNANIHVGGGKACYRQALDQILMPDKHLMTGTTTSDSTTSWYAVLLHELTHWTSHQSRLDRTLSNRFGDEAYAYEELIAELGSAFLCADLGISNVVRQDHVDYLANWIQILKSNHSAFFTAAGAAEKAAEFCHQLQPQSAQKAA